MKIDFENKFFFQVWSLCQSYPPPTDLTLLFSIYYGLNYDNPSLRIIATQP